MGARPGVRRTPYAGSALGARVRTPAARSQEHMSTPTRAPPHTHVRTPLRAHARTHARTHTRAVTFDALVTTPMTIETSHLREISYYRISGVHHSFFSPTSLSEARASITPQFFSQKSLSETRPSMSMRRFVARVGLRPVTHDP